MTEPARALLITGTVGAGKTSVADALGDLLAEAGVPGAVIDVDWLRRAWPSPTGDPFHHALALRNLRAVAGNHVDAGAARIVLAAVVETDSGRDAYRAALGLPLTVCRLRVDLPTVHRRLGRRHDGDADRLAWHLARAGELDRILDAARVEDVVVDAGHGTAREVAQAVRHAICW